MTRKRVAFTAEHFAADPTLYDRVKQAWEGKQWYVLFGEWPKDMRVMAHILPKEEGGGIVFYYDESEMPRL